MAEDSAPPRVARASPEDAAALATIHATSFAEPWSADALLRLLVTPAALALKASRDVGLTAGFVLGFLAADEAEILTIAVVPDERGYGIGRRLLRNFADTARIHGARSVYLEVAQSNLAARRLYGSLGYMEVGRRKGYYRHETGSEDAVVLSKALDGDVPARES